MISKILVPYDASAFSNAAFKQALEIAKKFNAKIQVLSVLGKDVQEKEISSFERAIEMQDNEENLATKMLMDLEKTAKEEGVEFSFKTIFDPDPGKGITAFVNANDFDLVVIGSHGRTGLQKRILGSVAHSVVEHADCPVLLIKLKK